MRLEPLAIPPGRALRAESIDVIVWGIHDRRPRWGFQVSACGSQDERSDVPIRPTNSIPNEMDRHIRRFPPAGPNPSDSIPLMPRDELFPLEADSSVSARGRTGSLLQSQPIQLPVLVTTDAPWVFPVWRVLDGLSDFCRQCYHLPFETGHLSRRSCMLGTDGGSHVLPSESPATFVRPRGASRRASSVGRRGGSVRLRR
jgi:hypothetical protein